MKLLLDQLDALIILFKPHCRDVETLSELQSLLGVEKEWIRAHYLFTRIRSKTLKAVAANDDKTVMQYAFEEICAKTLHNLTDTDQPFDPDSPYWVVPFALKFARALKLDEQDVIDIALS